MIYPLERQGNSMFIREQAVTKISQLQTIIEDCHSEFEKEIESLKLENEELKAENERLREELRCKEMPEE